MKNYFTSVFRQKKDLDLVKNNINDFFDKITELNNEKEYADEIKNFIAETNDFIDRQDERKDAILARWEDIIPKILLAWFVLIATNQFAESVSFVKYFVLGGGVVISWFTLVSLSLQGQKISFARNCIKSLNNKRKNLLCILGIQDTIFNNSDGMTAFHESVTQNEIRQLYAGLCVLVVCLGISLVQDLTQWL